jgi:capsular polysaccharide biosynthesis protein
MEQEIDLLELWEMIKKRWAIVIAIPLIAALTSGIVSFFILKPVYQASTTLIVGKKASDNLAQQAGQLLEYNVLQANKQLAKTYETIARSRTVEANVINELGLSLTPEQLNGKVTVSSVKDTEVLMITIEDQDPVVAADIANMMVQKFAAAVIDIKKVDSVSIVDKATPPLNPIKPNKTQNVLIAFAAGLIASLGLALLLEFLDNTVKSSKDVENILGLPVLGVIPHYDIEKAS